MEHGVSIKLLLITKIENRLELAGRRLRFVIEWSPGMHSLFVRGAACSHLCLTAKQSAMSSPDFSHSRHNALQFYCNNVLMSLFTAFIYAIKAYIFK